jgi:hypothetical protein
MPIRSSSYGQIFDINVIDIILLYNYNNMSYYIPAIHISKYIIDHSIKYEDYDVMMNAMKIIETNEVQYLFVNENRVLRINLTRYNKEYYSEILQYQRLQLHEGYIVIPTVKYKSIFKFDGTIKGGYKNIETECEYDGIRVLMSKSCDDAGSIKYFYKIFSQDEAKIAEIISLSNSSQLSP